jgi:hypothetical protein
MKLRCLSDGQPSEIDENLKLERLFASKGGKVGLWKPNV